jgi:hypothetical protein
MRLAGRVQARLGSHVYRHVLKYHRTPYFQLIILLTELIPHRCIEQRAILHELGHTGPGSASLQLLSN